MNIFTTISAFFNMIMTVINSVNRLANAGDKYCSIAEAHAETTYDQYVLESKAATEKLKQQLADLEAKEPTVETQTETQTEAIASTKTVDL
jgi:hypothetical protein